MPVVGVFLLEATEGPLKLARAAEYTQAKGGGRLN
jgi:hypothetical protein